MHKRTWEKGYTKIWDEAGLDDAQEMKESKQKARRAVMTRQETIRARRHRVLVVSQRDLEEIDRTRDFRSIHERMINKKISSENKLVLGVMLVLPSEL